jgi:hypothetical protein
MRILSQLVPGGQPISTDIEGARQPGRNIWEIPSWGRPLALGVYPFFVIRDRRLLPVGTAFCISKLGVSVTALHNIQESVHHSGHDGSLRQRDVPPTSKADRRMRIAVFHHQALTRGRPSGKILSFEGIEEVGPTDICYVFPQFPGGFPYLPLPVSFETPRIGSRVVCVGFGNPSVPGGSLSLDDAQSERLNLLDIYEHKLFGVEARVTRIFTHRFAPGFIGGPCCTIDAEIEHNMYGGPVLSAQGYVCGVVSARATDFLGEPSSIVSLLYPALAAKVRFDGKMGVVRISSNLRLVDLIAQGSVITDGSERIMITLQDGGEFSLSPAIPTGDTYGVYKDLSDLQKGRRADRESRE